MTRTLALCLLAALLAGCQRYHSRAQGPFARHDKDAPPPAASAPRPVANQSPLALGAGAPAPGVNPDDRSVVPPRGSGVAPAAGVLPPADLDDPNAFPPLRRRPEPKPGSMPSPLAPKAGAPADKAAPPATDAKGPAELKALLASATAAWKAVDTFEGTLTRREINPKGEATSEVVLFQFRREPMAVFTRTLSEKGKGREVVYNPSQHGDKLHVMVGVGDHPLFKAGKIAPSMSPDSPMVKEKARHSIRDAGFGRHLAALSDAVAKVEAGKRGPEALTYQARVKRDELPEPAAAVTHALRPGDDPLFPNGGSRTYFFDVTEKSPSFGLPVLIVATDAGGKEAEYYLFEKVKLPANLTDADFSPDRLGKK